MSNLPSLRCLFASILILSACTDSPQASAQKGEDLLARGRFPDAEIEFRKALQKDPSLGQAQAGLSRAIAGQGKESDAVPEFRKAIQMLPSDARLIAEYAELILTAITLIPNADPVYVKEASILIQKLDALNGPAYDRHRLAGAFAAYNKDWPTAISKFRDAAAIAPPLINATHLGLARSLYLSGAKAEARSAVEKLLTQNPRASDVYDLLYFFALFEKDPAQGEAVLEREYSITKNPNTVLALARHFERNNAHQKALDTLKRLTPQGVEMTALPVGEFLLAAREPGLAIQYFDAVKATKYRPRALLLKLEATILSGSLEVAKKLAADAVAEFPNDIPLASQRAALLVRHGNESERKAGLEAFDTIRKSNPDDAEATYNLAVAYLALGKSSEGSVLLRESIRKSPAYVAPKLSLGEIELRSNHGASAANLAQDCLALQPENWSAKLLLASANAMIGLREESSRQFQQLAQVRPNDKELRLRMAFLQLSDRKFREAETGFRALYEPGNADIRAIVGLTNALAAMGQAPAVIQLLEAEIKIQKNPILLKSSLASQALNSGQLEYAARVSAELLQATQRSIDALLLQSEILQAQGKLSEALKLAEEAEQKSPGNLLAVKRLAFLQHISGKLSEAEKLYRLALQQDNQSWDAANNLATILTDSGQKLDEAERLGRKLVEAQPLNLAYQDTLGWTLVRSGRPQEAIPIFRSLTQKIPDSALLAFHHGIALIDAGQVQQGKVLLTAAKKKKGDPETLKQIEARLKSL